MVEELQHWVYGKNKKLIGEILPYIQVQAPIIAQVPAPKLKKPKPFRRNFKTNMAYECLHKRKV